MNRRGFMSLFTLGAVGTAASANTLPATPKSNSETDGPVEQCVKFSIRSPVEEVKPETNDHYTYVNDQRLKVVDPFGSYGSKKTKEIVMTVGQDGNLWIQTEDSDWKRVVTE